MRKILFLIMVLGAGISLAAQNPYKIESDQVKKTIDSLNRAMEKVFNDNDMMATAAFYSDDAEIVASTYRVFGRKSLDDYWMSLKDRGRGWKLTVYEVGGVGDVVYQLGNSDLTYISKGKETKSVTNFVLLWKKQPDGTYKIYRDYLTNTGFSQPK